MKKPFTYLSVALISLVIILNGCGSDNSPSTGAKDPSAQEVLATAPVYKRTEIISSPDVAKELLIGGNERFTSGKPLSKDLSFKRRTELLENGQHPFAVVVSCSDSRVPPEILFDQALGDLFVIRVAGNVVTPVELGSVEYAVDHLKTPLVVVLGHEECGAVTAAVQGGETHGSIGAILEKLGPSVDEAKAMSLTDKNLIEKSSELNIKNVLTDISKSSIIREAVESNHVKLLGMKYDLDKGILDIIPS